MNLKDQALFTANALEKLAFIIGGSSNARQSWARELNSHAADLRKSAHSVTRGRAESPASDQQASRTAGAAGDKQK